MAFAHSLSRTVQTNPGTVLVAYDDPTSTEIISAMLQESGWQVETASNGKHDRDVLASHHIDAIILDMCMPELDDYEVCLSLFRQGRKRPTRVITGRVGDSEPLGYLNVTRTLNKPVKLQDVLDFVESATESQ